MRENIRNFCIISHIDHGKSTLADRLLELTNTVEKRKMREQILDSMELEREKGITIKLQPARMEYNGYILNLIDTPGHVDFSYEVSRSLAAVEGAILLVDASQGIQAQTLANLHLAQEQDLKIIPVINKIDMVNARTDEAVQEISQLLGVNSDEIIRISAKRGDNIDKVLEAIINRIPSPQGKSDNSFKALIFDSDYDKYKGVIAYLRVIDGEIKKGEKIFLSASKTETDIIELGIFKPEPVQKELLKAGDIGYIATGLKDINLCRVGDTIVNDLNTSSLSGYKEPKPVVFAGFYPANPDDYDLLKDGLSKLKLNDASLQYEPESSEGLGRGFRCGFLGMLHMEIVSERLRREYDLSLVITSPSVDYKIVLKDRDKTINISSPSDLPDINRIKEIQEPWINLEVITPNQYLGQAMKLLSSLRGEYKDTQYLTPERAIVKYQVPLNEIIVNFYDQLKNTTSGYASMSYELIDYRLGDLLKLDILIAGEKADAFSRIIPKSRAHQEAKSLVSKLKELIPRHQFAIPLQAVINSKIIARETIKAYRKDVIAGLYGGDYTRKRKLLEKQKKGKKKMKSIGKVTIPQEVFLKALKK